MQWLKQRFEQFFGVLAPIRAPTGNQITRTARAGITGTEICGPCGRVIRVYDFRWNERLCDCGAPHKKNTYVIVPDQKRLPERGKYMLPCGCPGKSSAWPLSAGDEKELMVCNCQDRPSTGRAQPDPTGNNAQKIPIKECIEVLRVRDTLSLFPDLSPTRDVLAGLAGHQDLCDDVIDLIMVHLQPPKLPTTGDIFCFRRTETPEKACVQVRRAAPRQIVIAEILGNGTAPVFDEEGDAILIPDNARFQYIRPCALLHRGAFTGSFHVLINIYQNPYFTSIFQPRWASIWTSGVRRAPNEI